MDAGEAGKTPQVQSWDCGSEGHPSLPRIHGSAHQKVTFPEVGEGDRPGLQDRPAIPVSSNTVSPGGIRGIPCGAVRRCQPVCHPRQASYHHAEGYPVGQTNPRRAGVKSHHKNTHLGPFQDHPILQKE